MPGSGITENNINDLAGRTGACEFHASLRHKVPRKMVFYRENVHMGMEIFDEYESMQACEERIRAAKQQLSSIVRQ